MWGLAEHRLRRLTGACALASFTFCAGYLLAKAGGASVTAPVAGPPGHIVVAETTYQAGTLKPGQVVVHPFAFRNEGPGTLQIFKVRTSCGCTAAVLSKKQLAPGESGSLEVTFKSSGFRGDVHKEIYLTTNDPKEHRTTLSLEAHVEVVAALAPDASSVELAPGEQKVFHATLVPTQHGKGIKVTSLESSDPRVTTSALRQDPSGIWSFDVTARGGGADPAYLAVVKVHTDSTLQDVFEYAISVQPRAAQPSPAAGDSPSSTPAGAR